MEDGFLCRKLLSPLIWSLLYHISVFATIDLPSSTTTYVQKGGKFILVCRVPLTGFHMWYKDGKTIVPNSINKYHLQQDFPSFSTLQQVFMQGNEFFMTMKLTVENAEELHTGDYKCINTSPYSQKVVVITENMIETNEDEPGMGKLLVPGEDLVLQCNTTECPQCRVVWFKDGVPVVNSEGHLTVYEEDNSIVIQRATYNDSGVYVCAIDREQLDIALNATIVVQSEIKLTKFESSDVFVQGETLVLFCLAKGAPKPFIKWFKGNEEISSNHQRIKLLDHDGLKNAKLMIEEADYEDRAHYTCEAYNQVNSLNTTIFIRIKDRLAALWPFLGICVEVAILCSIIFVYEKRKNSQYNEAETDLPTENRTPHSQKQTSQDLRQRK